jgi:integrase
MTGNCTCPHTPHLNASLHLLRWSTAGFLHGCYIRNPSFKLNCHMARPPMGLHRRGKIWWISVQDPAGKQRRESSGSSNKRVAERLLAIRKAEAIEQRLGLPRSHSPRLEDWAKVFLLQVSHPNTRDRYSASVNNLVKFFGNLRLADISPDRILEFQQSRIASGIRAATVNRDRSVLSRMMNKAKKLRYILSNSCQDVDPLEERRERRQARPLTFEEEERLLAASEPMLATLVTVVIETGLRPRKEALVLRWVDLNLNETNPSLVVRCSKTQAGVRTVPLTARCLHQLKAWREFVGKDFSVFVLPSPKDPCTHWKVYQDAWERASTIAKLRDRRFYDLRSTFATRAHSVYPNDLAVARVLGHSTPAILPTYAKGSDENTRSMIIGLDALRRRERPETVQ